MIEHMRSYFQSAGHGPVDPVVFAGGILATQKAAVQRQLAIAGFATAGLLHVLEITLGDPAAPVGEPLLAYVNAGHWLVKCECGGCEFVDLEMPIAMCCSCWNAAVGHAWRPVALPEDRLDIEEELVMRPTSARNWRPDEPIELLIAENVEHGL